MEHLGYELTADLSREAFERDKTEMMEAFSPKYVTIRQEPAPAGCMGLFKVTVHCKSFILTGERDTTPRPVDELAFRVMVYDSYPAIAPKLYFEPGRRLAHVNTYRSGTECIDKWGKYSSLKNVVEKTIRAIVFDENVTRYESMACSSIKEWQQEMAKKKVFPTLNPPDLILKANAASAKHAGPVLPPPLPGKYAAPRPVRSPLPPPLPGRR